jgi:hypothetical protein
MKKKICASKLLGGEVIYLTTRNILPDTYEAIMIKKMTKKKFKLD